MQTFPTRDPLNHCPTCGAVVILPCACRTSKRPERRLCLSNVAAASSTNPIFYLESRNTREMPDIVGDQGCPKGQRVGGDHFVEIANSPPFGGESSAQLPIATVKSNWLL